MQGGEEAEGGPPVLLDLDLDLRQRRGGSAEHAEGDSANELAGEDRYHAVIYLPSPPSPTPPVSHGGALDRQEDGRVLHGGKGVGGHEGGQEGHLVRVERPPVLGGAGHPAVEQHAPVGGVHALHQAVQVALQEVDGRTAWYLPY